MNKVVLIITLAFAGMQFSSIALASDKTEIQLLKNTPATLYDVGKGKLDLLTKIAHKKFKGERVKKTKFKVAAIGVTEENNKLQINAITYGKAKYLTQEHCNKVLVRMQEHLEPSKLPRILWSGLSNETYSKLESEITLRVAIADKEDKNNNLTCQ